MAMEKEALTHRIEDDLARRNRNWDKIDTHIAESETQFNRLQHYGALMQAPYNNGDERWHDVSGIGIYYVSTSHEGYPSSLGILIHINHPSTSAIWQLFFGPPGSNWTRRVTGGGSFADSTWVAM